MFQDNWRSLAFWRWWWRSSVPVEVKAPVAVVLVGFLLVGGYFAAGQMSGAKASTESSADIFETTVRKVVTVREHGKLVVKRVPVVVRRVVVRSRTAYQTAFQTVVDTRVVTTKGGVRLVVKEVPRLVQVERVVTNQSTVVVNHTDTVVQPVTSIATVTATPPAVTVTEVRTVTETVTVPTTTTVTVTVPAAP